MSLLFIGLSVPVLVFILVYNYNRNSAGIVSILNDAVAQTSRAGIDRTQELIEATELFAGTRRRVATRKMPTFVLRTRELVWKGAQGEVRASVVRRTAFAVRASASGSFHVSNVPSGSEALSSTRTVAPKGNINLTFDDAVFPL
jgi:hypothetical protein